jgi:hypothetical protein
MSEKNITKYFVEKPVYDSLSAEERKSKNPAMILLNKTLIPENDYSLTLRWLKKDLNFNPYVKENVSENDKIIIHLGTNSKEQENLGGEIEFMLGNEILTTDNSSSIYIPSGVKHGNLKWKRFEMPHLEVTIDIPSGKGITHSADKKFSAYFVKKPAYEVVPEGEVKGRRPAMTMMSNNLVPGSNIYIETGWVFGMPDPNPHIFKHEHNYNEIVLHMGTDPENQDELGGEIEFMVAGKPLILNKTSVVYVPVDIDHGPLIWKKCEKPHLEFTAMLGAGSVAQADPGGHEKRREGK